MIIAAMKKMCIYWVVKMFINYPSFVQWQTANTKVHRSTDLSMQCSHKLKFFLETPSQHESKMKDTSPSVLRQEIVYKPLITSPTVQAPQGRLPLISTRHGQTDLVILHSFLCSSNCKQVFKAHKQLHCMGVYQTALLFKKTFVD